MKLSLLCISKTTEKYLQEGIAIYENRLQHYCKYQRIEIPDLKNSKNLSFDQQKQKEAELLLAKISNTDFVVLLDENGKEYSSMQLSKELTKWMNQSISHVVFVIGGPYGFDQSVYERANLKISLSKLTFSHQMVRLFFTEQVYRAFSIIKGEPYHHQ
jgi:23S rRNA (pseudouridine1915-N3)-methyltransferase